MLTEDKNRLYSNQKPGDRSNSQVSPSRNGKELWQGRGKTCEGKVCADRSLDEFKNSLIMLVLLRIIIASASRILEWTLQWNGLYSPSYGAVRNFEKL